VLGKEAFGSHVPYALALTNNLLKREPDHPETEEPGSSQISRHEYHDLLRGLSMPDSEKQV
jgi:hypothetical protein